MYFLIVITLYLLWVVGYFLWERNSKKQAPPSPSQSTPISSELIMGKSTFVLGENKPEETSPPEKKEHDTLLNKPISLEELNKAFQNFSSEKNESEGGSEPEHQKEHTEPEDRLEEEEFDENDDYYQSQSCTIAAIPIGSPISADDLTKAFQVLVHNNNSTAEEKREAVKILDKYQDTELFQSLMENQTKVVSDLMNTLPPKTTDIIHSPEEEKSNLNIDDFV